MGVLREQKEAKLPSFILETPEEEDFPDALIGEVNQIPLPVVHDCYNAIMDIWNRAPLSI
jgi:hypothetical protein